jgi:hypothetical protein
MTSADEKKMRPHGLQISYPTVMLLCSSCLALSEADYPCALWNQTVLWAMNVFYASKSVHILLQIKFHAFLSCMRLFYCFITHIFKFLEPNRSSTLKMDFEVSDSFVSPS